MRLQGIGVRTVLLTCVALLLSLNWAMAQQSAAGSGKSVQGSAHTKTIEGCVRGSKGAYSLTDKHSGVTYYLTGVPLDQHAGQTVQLTGVNTSLVVESKAGYTSNESEGTLPTFKVDSVSEISANCGH